MNNKVLVLVLMSDRVESRKWNMIQSVLQTFRARTLFRRSIFKLFLTNVSLESLDSKKKNWSEVLNRVIHHFFKTIFSKLKMRQPFWMSFRTLNPKFQKNRTKTEAAPALPCLASQNWLIGCVWLLQFHCVLNLQIETRKRGKTWDIHFWTPHGILMLKKYLKSWSTGAT